jgi:hypothetical protein
MKIRVSTIPHSGMKIDAPIPLEPLNARMQEGSRGTDITFTAPPNADLTLRKLHGATEVSGIVSAPCNRLCATCGNEARQEVVAEIDWVLQSLEESGAGPGDEIEDPGVIAYRGDHVDLEDPLQEALILTLTPFWHPERDECGRCTVCQKVCSGKNTSSEREGDRGTQRLGDLLAKATAKRGSST